MARYDDVNVESDVSNISMSINNGLLTQLLSILSFSSPDVMRFLGKKIPLSGQIPGRFAGELVSDLKRRAEGDRIKHRIDQNSLFSCLVARPEAHEVLSKTPRIEILARPKIVPCKHEFAFLSNLCRIIRIVMMIRFSSLFLLSH